MPALAVRFLTSTRGAASVLGYVVEDTKVLGRRTWNVPGHYADSTLAKLFEFQRLQGGGQNSALLHVVLSFADGTPVTVDQAFEYFAKLVRETPLEHQATVAAAHEGRPHLHAVISRVDDRGRLVEFRVNDLVERERELALHYGLGAIEARDNPLPASVVNAQTWEGHLAFTTYLRALPWPEPTGNRDADATAIKSLLIRLGVGVVRSGRGWQLRTLYRGREDRAKASVCVPRALRSALSPLEATPDNPHSYGALREAGKLILPDIKRGAHFEEVTAANERSAKGLGYWHRRLHTPPATWTAATEERSEPKMIAFVRTGDPEVDLQIQARLDFEHDDVDITLIDDLRADLARSETVKRVFANRTVIFGRDDIALAVRLAAEHSDPAIAAPIPEGVVGPLRAFVLLPDPQRERTLSIDTSGSIFYDPGDRGANETERSALPAISVEPQIAFFPQNAELRGVVLAGSLPQMYETAFLDQLRSQLSPREQAALRERYAVARTAVDRTAAQVSLEELARKRAGEHEDPERADIEEALGQHRLPSPEILAEEGLTPTGERDLSTQIEASYHAFWDAMDAANGKPYDRVSFEDLRRHGHYYDAQPYIARNKTHYGSNDYVETSHENFSTNWRPVRERTPELDKLYDRFQTLVGEERRQEIDKSVREDFENQRGLFAPDQPGTNKGHDPSLISPAGDAEPCVIAPATEGDHAAPAADHNGSATSNNGPLGESRGAAQVSRLLNAWGQYLDAQGVNPDRSRKLLARQHAAISAHVRLAAEMKARELGNRGSKEPLLKTLNLLAKTTAEADFALAGAAVDLHRPLYSPGEFAIAKDTQAQRAGLNPADIFMALGRGEHSLPIGARPMAVATALANITFTDPEKQFDRKTQQDYVVDGYWTVSEGSDRGPTTFTERPDGYHFSPAASEVGLNGIRAAILLAANADDGAVTLRGNAGFQTMVSRAAAEMGIVVTNDRDRFSRADSEQAVRTQRAQNIGSRDAGGAERHLAELLSIPSMNVYQDVPHRDDRLTIVDAGGVRSDKVVCALAYDAAGQLVCGLLPPSPMTETVRTREGTEERPRDYMAGDIVDLHFDGTRPRTEAVEEHKKEFTHSRELLESEREIRTTRPAPVQSR